VKLKSSNHLSIKITSQLLDLYPIKQLIYKKRAVSQNKAGIL